MFTFSTTSLKLLRQAGWLCPCGNADTVRAFGELVHSRNTEPHRLTKGIRKRIFGEPAPLRNTEPCRLTEGAPLFAQR
jgi:hypothetical protein